MSTGRLKLIETSSLYSKTSPSWWGTYSLPRYPPIPMKENGPSTGAAAPSSDGRSVKAITKMVKRRTVLSLTPDDRRSSLSVHTPVPPAIVPHNVRERLERHRRSGQQRPEDAGAGLGDAHSRDDRFGATASANRRRSLLTKTRPSSRGRQPALADRMPTWAAATVRGGWMHGPGCHHSIDAVERENVPHGLGC